MELERKLRVSGVFALEFYFPTGRGFGVFNIPVPLWGSVGTDNPLVDSTGGFCSSLKLEGGGGEIQSSVFMIVKTKFPVPHSPGSDLDL